MCHKDERLSAACKANKSVVCIATLPIFMNQYASMPEASASKPLELGYDTFGIRSELPCAACRPKAPSSLARLSSKTLPF